MSKKKITLYELIRTEDEVKRVCGIGNSVEISSETEAEKMVAAGTHKYEDLPIGVVRRSVFEEEETIEDKPPREG